MMLETPVSVSAETFRMSYGIKMGKLPAADRSIARCRLAGTDCSWTSRMNA